MSFRMITQEINFELLAFFLFRQSISCLPWIVLLVIDLNENVMFFLFFYVSFFFNTQKQCICQGLYKYIFLSKRLICYLVS